MGLWLLLGGVGLLVFGGIAAAAVYFLVFAKPAPHLARYVPKTTTVYIEMPSLKKSMISAAGIKPLDNSRVDEKQMMEDTITAFANSFMLTPDEARAVVGGIDSASVAFRDTSGKMTGAVTIQFSSTGAAEKLLKSSRFIDMGSYGSGDSKRYTLDRRPSSSTSGGRASFLEEGLNDMNVDKASKKDRLVWFPKNKLLVLGDDEFVMDMSSVQGNNLDSLEKSESYIKAKKTFESGSDVAFFFDTHDLDNVHDKAVTKALASYLANRDPVTGAIKIVKAGVMMDVHATLSGTGMPPEDLYPKASKLTYPKRLPADTVGYMAFSTKTKLSGAAVRGLMIKQVEDHDPVAAKDLKDTLDAMEKGIGFKFDDVVDMVGDEMAIGILLDPTFKLDTTNGMQDELSNVGMVWAIATKDDAKAKLVLSKLRAQLEAPAMADIGTTKPIGDGFEFDPDTVASYPIPSLTVKYDGKQIVAVLAAGALTGRAFDALQSGKGTLGGEQAHELAFNAMPQDANFYMWMDTGRITSVMMDGATHVKKGSGSSPFPMDAIRLTGPDRVTSAMAMRATVKNNIWSVDLDSLNMPAMALFSVASEIDVSGMGPKGSPFGGGKHGHHI